jgi:cell pole-organizing protein PopZ
MEEILASVRRTIANDDASKLPPKPAEAPGQVSPVAAPLSRPAVSPHAPESRPSVVEAEEEHLVESGLQDAGILDLAASMAAPAAAEAAPMPEEASSAMVESFPHSGDAKSEAATFDVSDVASFAPAPSPEPDRMDEQAAEGVPGVKRAPAASFQRHSRGRRLRVQCAGANCSGGQCAHARRSGSRVDAADAEDLARR